ncbi:MAG: putative sufE-like protein [Parachlamydiales bacterium]|nr:putative sufE-like protein [Parachlamydiales bacterium]
MIEDAISIEKRIDKIKEMFATSTPEEKMIRLLDLGRSLPPYPGDQKTTPHLVPGCQSTLYLYSHLENGRVHFEACADALISAGLAALLIYVYSSESPEIILKTPPSFLANLGILDSLTPSRSNGLAHIHQRMKKDSLKFLLSTMISMDLNPAPH